MSTRAQLESYLKQLEQRLRLGVLLRGTAIVTSAALTITVVLVLIANAFAFSAGSLITARVVLFLALVCAGGLGLALPLYRLNRRRAASSAEVVFPQFQQRLVTFAELGPGGRDPFMELLAADTLELARTARPAHVVPGRKLLSSLATGAISLGVLIWMIGAGPGYLGYGAARLWAGSRRGAAPFYDIRVSPGDAAVRRGANQVVTAQLVGFDSPQAHLFARYQSASQWERTAMQPLSGASGFQFVFAGLPESVEYYVEAGPLQSRHFNLRIADLPLIKQIRVTYHFAAWTGLQNVVEKQGGDLCAVEGTEAGLAVLTDRPMRDGVLVLDNEREIALSGGEGNVYKGALRIERDGSYHVAAVDQGQRVRLSDDFFIEARKANPPDVRITQPGRDYRASPIEEVTVSVKATDDYGLNDVRLHYSVNGGAEQAVNMLKQKGLKEADGSTTLCLEEFKLVPGDLVSLYATAKDARSESRSDMFFIQAEPFEREYSQSQLAGGGGGDLGSDEYEISQRQKEIIAATWKQLGAKQATRQQAAEAGNFLAGVQAKLRDRALSLAGRLQRRELTEENEEFSAFQRDMTAAAEAMGPASRKLEQQKWNDAIPSEQKALQYLLRAEATFRQIQVAFGSRGGGGRRSGAGRDLANLFDLELDTEKNQYETGQTAASTNQRAQEIDRALQKLDELARREQELAGQQRSNNGQIFQQRWEQEMLRREAEQLQKQIEQLAQGLQPKSQQSSSASTSQAGKGGSDGGGQRLQQALDRLRQANEDLRRAGSPGQREADARRAADRLREAADLLGGIRQQQASGPLDSLAREADRLSSEQRDQADRMRRMFSNKDAANSPGQLQSDVRGQEQAKLADDRQLTAADLARLEKAMQNAARGLTPTERSAASKLHEALSEMDQSELQSRLQRSAELIREGADANANSMEPAIAAGMQRLSEQMHETQQALKRQQQGAPEEALDRVERLRSQLEALTRGLDARNAHGHGQDQQGQGSRQGREAQGGQGSQAGSASDGFHSGGPGGPRTWRGGLDTGVYIEPPGIARQSSPDSGPDSGAAVGLALRNALRELNGLRREVRSQPESLDTVLDLIRELQHLGPGSFPGNPALVEQLRRQVLANVDKLELQLRRDLDDKQSGHIRSGDSLRVPSGYENPVAEYFRRLSKNR